VASLQQMQNGGGIGGSSASARKKRDVNSNTCGIACTSILSNIVNFAVNEIQVACYGYPISTRNYRQFCGKYATMSMASGFTGGAVQLSSLPESAQAVAQFLSPFCNATRICAGLGPLVMQIGNNAVQSSCTMVSQYCQAPSLLGVSSPPSPGIPNPGPPPVQPPVQQPAQPPAQWYENYGDGAGGRNCDGEGRRGDDENNGDH
jgi:hypothetical protein